MERKKKERKLIGRVTLQNIADEAQISVASVSAVLSNRHIERRIALGTVEKVRTVAAKLGYLPNIGARRLRRGESGGSDVIVALITSYEAPFNIANQFVYALRRSVAETNQRPQARAFSLTIEMFYHGRLRELPGLLTGEHFNAAIIANTTPLDDQYLSQIHLPYPVVLVDRAVTNYSYVLEDPKTGALAADVLVRDGRRTKLAVLHGTPTTHTTQARVDNFLAATTRLIGRQPQVIVAKNLSEMGAYEAMSKFLANGGAIDALYAVSDNLALGAYHAIMRRKLRIPSDVAVVGTGDNEISAFFAPPLSWVGVPRARIGEEVSRLLLAQLDDPSRKAEYSEIPAQTTLRESTGHRGEF
ncbi:MAG: LacI family transcriptional regulator [Opitutus sp.]|nr:LacI family transcriptional regulator [Opitutus sp.]